jgi:SOS-response transcriptional repressor LexA
MNQIGTLEQRMAQASIMTYDKQIYDFIVSFKQTHDGNSPSFRDIQTGCGISTTSMVFYYLNKLEKRGLIRRPEPRFGSRYATKIEVVGGKWTFGGDGD